MHSYMKLKRYYILIINLLIGSVIFAQTVEDVVRFAGEQFENGNFSVAAQEYNRALFFGYNKVDEASIQIGHCYSELSNYDQAESFYDRAFKFSHSDSLKNEAVLGKTFCLLMQNKNFLALSELLYINDYPNLQQQTGMHFLKGIACYGLGDDTLAYDEFYTVLNLSDINDSVKTLLTNEFNKVYRYHKKYNPNRAYFMSGIFPGSGQISVGAYKDGINSMLLIAALSLVAVLMFRDHYLFIDVALALFPWIQRYYMGGMDKAKGLALSKIEAKRYESYLRIIELTTPKNYR
jgi:tetratricopeptide (TPR) repeat protein